MPAISPSRHRPVFLPELRPHLFALHLALPILQAEDELRAGASDDRIYDLVLLATGSEEAASAALTARVEERLRNNETPDV